jgi:CRISPR-associated exonuclease Cas4
LTNGLVTLLLFLALALGLRRLARAFVGPSARPQAVQHVDTGPNDETLVSHRVRLAGQPDFILQDRDGRFPMERKSRAVDSRGPYPSERLQLAAYCLLIEETDGRPARRGRLEYANGWVDVPFDAALRRQLLTTIDQMRTLRSSTDVRRSHASAGRCRGCGFRSRCTDALQI